ncbi:MAG: LuxR C-terminal-related transcriptional regulator [Chloroflexota bacterium]
MLDELTKREAEILQLISQGMSNQEIADTLFLSRGTIKAHNHNIYGKLGVRSRTQAILRAQELGIIQDTTSPSSNPTQAHIELPIITTPLIGRKQEIETMTKLLLDERVRLVTILGAGGMGKTHAAIEIAGQVSAQFTDGVYFISLAAINNSSNIAVTIMDTIGLPHKTGQMPEQVLLNFLQNKHILLVLDNFEHLLTDGIDFIAELLQDNPVIKLLVTSRERLRLSSEVIVVLEGLTYDMDEGDDPQVFSAIQLLLQRLQRITPDFQPTDGDWRSMQRICQLTQGMPLGIILAASWFEMLSLEEIAVEITASIDILQSQFRDLPERQRSMRATINSSWKRLSPEEQRIFANLSVFRGGFTRQAAQAIVGAKLFHLQTLVDRSFIVANEGRYQIHELLRQYASETLQHVSNAAEIYNGHSAYYLNWSAEIENDLKGANQAQALDDMRLELDNIRQAWDWAAQSRQFELVDAALETIFTFFLMLTRAQESSKFFDLILRQLNETPNPDLRLINRLRIRLGAANIFLGDQKFNQDDLETFVQRSREQQNPLETGLALDLLSTHIAYIDRDFAIAIQFSEEAIQQLEASGDYFHLASAYHKMGFCQLQVTGMQGLIDFTQKEYDIARAVGNLFNMGAALGNLGSAALYLGQYHEAERYYREAAFTDDLFGQSSGRSRIINFTHILLLLGKIEEAQRLLDKAWHNSQSNLEAVGLSFGYAMYGFIAIFDSEYDDALQNALTSLHEARNDVSITLIAHAIIAMAYCGLDDFANAEQGLHKSWQIAQQMNYFASTTWSLPVLVLLAIHQGDLENAVRYTALVRTHPLSPKPWLDEWSLFVEAEYYLKREIDIEIFARLWQEGQVLVLHDVVKNRKNDK